MDAVRCGVLGGSCASIFSRLLLNFSDPLSYMVPLAVMCYAYFLQVLWSQHSAKVKCWSGVLAIRVCFLWKGRFYKFPFSLGTSMNSASLPCEGRLCEEIVCANPGVLSQQMLLLVSSSCLCVPSQCRFVSFFSWGSLHFNRPSVWYFFLLTTCLHAEYVTCSCKDECWLLRACRPQEGSTVV